MRSESMKQEEEKEEGANLTEYVLLVALIAVVAIAATRLLGANISKRYSDIESAVTDA